MYILALTKTFEDKISEDDCVIGVYGQQKCQYSLATDIEHSANLKGVQHWYLVIIIMKALTQGITALYNKLKTTKQNNV